MARTTALDAHVNTHVLDRGRSVVEVHLVAWREVVWREVARRGAAWRGVVWREGGGAAWRGMGWTQRTVVQPTNDVMTLLIDGRMK